MDVSPARSKGNLGSTQSQVLENLPKDLDVEQAPETVLQQELRLKHDQILANPGIPWDAFQNAGVISEADLALLRKYETQSIDLKRTLFEESAEAYAALFMKICTGVANRESTRYALTLIDDVLQSTEAAVDVFLRLSARSPEWPVTAILRILYSQQEIYVMHRVSRILSVLLVKTPHPVAADVQRLVSWLVEQLKRPEIDNITVGSQAVMLLLRRGDFRQVFVDCGGVAQLSTLLRDQKSAQGLYNTVYSLWLLSYSSAIAARLPDATDLVARLADLLRTVQKEKIRRVALATLRNVMNCGAANQQMLDAGLLKTLEQLAARKWADEDLVADIETLRATLAQNVVEMTSFDAYKQELLSGRLDWSPVHRSEKFWRENLTRFEENQFAVIKQLVGILGNGDPKSMMVACFDLGEFVRFHPRGKAVAQATGAKVAVMDLMAHSDPGVQKEALLATQKMMVVNWEYLSGR